REGDRGRVPRPHPAGYRRRGLPAVPTPSREAGNRVQTVVEGGGGRHVRKPAQGEGRTGRRRARRDDRGGRGPGLRRARSLQQWTWARGGRRPERKTWPRRRRRGVPPPMGGRACRLRGGLPPA